MKVAVETYASTPRWSMAISLPPHFNFGVATEKACFPKQSEYVGTYLDKKKGSYDGINL